MFRARRHTPASQDGPHYPHPASVEMAELIAYRRYERTLPLGVRQVRSLQAGRLLSPFRGRGMEFVEARPYQPGDDIRHLDWRLTARLGKAHSKVFQEERERTVLFWVDLSPSMFFATRGAFKAVVAAHAAALIGWNAARLGDRVGGILTSPGHHLEIRPQQGKRGVLQLIRQLVRHPAWQQAAAPPEPEPEPGERFRRLRRVVKPGSLLFLLSDLRGLSSEDELQLSRMARHSDLVICHLHDRLERQLPPAGSYRITNGRQDKTLFTANPSYRRRYAQAFTLRQEYLHNLCLRQGLHLISLATHAELTGTLRRSLGGA
ncbi:DUF58 domain-containing protein [Desulfogranum mediterraneum]|uniref:DUF58 domain-containing protein n=1 Tax=Desulfogranum mediterraneum TaxID=160661 RepID=UPI00042154CB|nr:DUF58 domain-containing protein [Desulfogranum mediterraneum]